MENMETSMDVLLVTANVGSLFDNVSMKPMLVFNTSAALILGWLAGVSCTATGLTCSVISDAPGALK